ncbi:hypothetical protein B0H66DRAFT_584226 [Apodospora peruviana]|uniref:Peptidase C1A papain C-terminal domain-containing protein n=1 Tax=Apodospora peruviana TaxID=516989 RepID=A0AAE0HW05_9PEZI|nr:hypothetical protein B0H66DRAFT_584226 [Apodospora peruviana]
MTHSSQFFLVCSAGLLLAPISSASTIRPHIKEPRTPVPIPADTIPPVNWSSIHPSPYSPPRSRPKPAIANTKTVKLTNSLTAAASKTLTDAETPVLPSTVDWRNRSGKNYITTAQDQGVCQSCWAFAVTALVESMTRIEHGIWSKRSEADVHDGAGAACESIGNAQDTLAFLAGQGADYISDPDALPHGIADWPCDPYEATLHGYTPCADRAGRATHIPFYQALGLIEEQKRWIHEYGPIVATFVLYSDLKTWGSSSSAQGGNSNATGGGNLYKWNGNATTSGNHIALVVGYNDEKQAWIIKNSWGAGWGEGGFVYFGYGEANIDGWTKYGITNVNPDPWARKRHQSGNMMQSGNGETHRNFELLLSLRSNTTTTASRGALQGFTHFKRDGSTLKWETVSKIVTGTALIGQPAILGTSFNNRDFHAVAIDDEKNLKHWIYSEGANNSAAIKSWSQAPGIVNEGIDGYPGLVQAEDSSLVIVVKHSDGTLKEWHQSPRSSTGWTLASTITATNNNTGVQIAQSGSSLVQSNIGLDIYDPQGTSSGNLYVVAVRTDGTMQLFWRSASSSVWTPGEVFGSNIFPPDTPPVMIQDFYNTSNESSIGDFQLVVAVNGSVQHWRRSNDDIHLNPPSFGSSRVGEGKWEMFEQTAEVSGVRHVWSLVQGSFGQKMHMVTEGPDGSFSYWEWDRKWTRVENLNFVEGGKDPV